MMRKLASKLWAMMKRQNWALLALNSMALVMAIQNVNATCAFLDHQPEVPQEAKRFKKI